MFVVERLATVLDERRLAIVLLLHGLGKINGTAVSPSKLLAAFLCESDESTHGRFWVEVTILQTAQSPIESGKALREAAEYYKVDVVAMTAMSAGAKLGHVAPHKRRYAAV